MRRAREPRLSTQIRPLVYGNLGGPTRNNNPKRWQLYRKRFVWSHCGLYNEKNKTVCTRRCRQWIRARAALEIKKATTAVHMNLPCMGSLIPRALYSYQALDQSRPFSWHSARARSPPGSHVRHLEFPRKPLRSAARLRKGRKNRMVGRSGGGPESSRKFKARNLLQKAHPGNSSQPPKMKG